MSVFMGSVQSVGGLSFIRLSVCGCDDRNAGVGNVLDDNVTDLDLAVGAADVDLAHRIENALLRNNVGSLDRDDSAVA